MPFRSERQKGWLWANRPDIAKKWTNRYGGAVERRLNQQTHSEKKSGSRNVSKRTKRDAG